MDGIKEWYQSLSEQDQKITLIGGVIVLLILLYLLVIDPINQAALKAHNDVLAKTKTVEWMKQGVSKIRSSSGKSSAASNQQLAALVNSTTRKYNLPVSRRDSKSPNEMQVWFDNVSFNDFLRWTSEIGQRYGVKVATVNVRTRDRDGLASINVKLVK